RRQARLFGYDSEQNLCEVSQIAPGLGETLKVQDAVVQTSARYDAAGRVVERGHTQYRYDDCGRLAMKRETRPGFRPKETYFDWDVQDRLVRVSLPDGARWRYRYDAFGRRINKVREGQLPSAQAVARVAYRWDGDQLIGQQQYRADGSAAREVQWVYEPGSFRPLAQVEAQGDSTQLHYIVTDLTGTARELCSEEGEVHWRGEQGLWGSHREERRPIPLRRYLGDAANEEVYCELRYQGQLYDAETGLYYNRHRYYDAESGQYLSPDPIGILGGIRPQGYVHNPLEWVDPLGLAKAGCFETEHTVVSSGKAPKTSTPNSIYEVSRADGSRSITYYDDKGRTFSREDYGQQRTHDLLGYDANGKVPPHEHRITYNDRGYVDKKHYRELDKDGKAVGPWILDK
uniref:RHS repeat-associated core domain-containing protein n=1 Tax=Pectobacterium polaris TaxID=2042057 RepID=UPI0020C6486E